MHAIQESSQTLFTYALNTGYYAIDCTKKLLTDIDSISSITRLSTVVIRVAAEELGHPVLQNYYDICETIVDWTAATKLPSRASDIATGECVKNRFFGVVNVPKIVSKWLLIANDYFNTVRHLVRWGIIAQEVGQFITIGLPEATINWISRRTAFGAWSLDLSDAVAQMYERGPSLQSWLTILGDGSKLVSLITQGNTTGIVAVVNLGSNLASPMLSLVKTVVKEYDLQIPTHLYA
jgi:hypothetical protein